MGRLACAALLLSVACARGGDRQVGQIGGVLPPARARPQPPPPDDEVIAGAAALAGQLVVNGRAFDYLRELTDRFGPRLTGSPVLEGAVAWSLGVFGGMGLDDVHLEEVTVPNRWERGPATARLVVPFGRDLHVMAVPWSPPTAQGGLRARVVVITDLDPRRLSVDELRGNIVAIDFAELQSRLDGGEISARIPIAYELFTRAGVRGIVWGGTRPGQIMKVGGIKYPEGRTGAWPAVNMGMEDFRLIARLAEQSPVELLVTVATRVGGPVRVANVLADLRGREHPEEVVLVGAHLDAWDLATGAQDNGAGVAMVLEAARALAATGRSPRRTIRFALWTGEEQGMLGSRTHAAARSSELDRVVAVLNSDSGAGAPYGWLIEGRADVRDALRPISRRLLGGLGDEVAMTYSCDSDHATFFAWGVPVLDLAVDGSRYGDVHHLASDTIDKVSPSSLTAGAAIMALTAWALAERPQRLAPRLSQKEVDRLFAAQGDATCAELRKEPQTAK